MARLFGLALTAALSIAQPLFPDVVVDVPGRPASSHFTAEVFYNGSWQSVYVFETVAKAAQRVPNSNGYFDHLTNWTQSWVSSQLGAGQEQIMLRVRRADSGPAIASAAVHPASAHVQILNISATEGVTLVVDHAARVAVDMDGTMDATDTGPAFAGPPRHTFCWFVDAQVTLPDPAAPGSIVVHPGDPWPSSLNPQAWQTVIFAPGVHRFFSAPPLNWTMQNLTAQTRYFLCAGAIVHAALHGGASEWGQNGVTVDGFGVLSGEEMSRDTSTPDNASPQGVVFSGMRNASLLGITLVDFPNHHIILGQFAGDTLRNVKVLGWRANGDGVHVFSSWNVSDLFLRTQDDSLYLDCGGGASTSFERITTWNDANGVAFLFSPGGGSIEAGVTLHDSDAIYTRTSWYWWGPNTVFVQRGVTDGQVMSGVVVDDIRVEDPLPAFNPFRLDVFPSDGSPVPSSFSFRNVSFRNIVVANFSTIRQGYPVPVSLPHGIPNTIFAASDTCNISDVSFVNVTLAGLPMRALVADPTVFNLSAVGLFNVTVDGEPIARLIEGYHQ